MNLVTHLGDTKSFRIPLRWQNRPFLPGNEWHLVFTAKLDPADDDWNPPIQLELAAGITISGHLATISLSRALTVALAPATLHWDIQAERLASDEVRTVRRGTLTLLRDVTRDRKSPIAGNRLRDDLGTLILDDATAPLIYT